MREFKFFTGYTGIIIFGTRTTVPTHLVTIEEIRRIVNNMTVYQPRHNIHVVDHITRLTND